MDNDASPPGKRLSADQRIYHLGYDAGKRAGYNDGHTDGAQEGEEAFQAWLLEELALLVQDIHLHLRHDLATPLDVLAAVTALVEESTPVWAEDEAEGATDEVDPWNEDA